MLAIEFCVKHFRPYLYGRKFTLVTDHRPLVWLHGLKDPASRLVRWRIKLSEYEYDIAYKPGRVISNADALSRNPCDNGGINIDPLYVEESQRFVLAERGELSKACSAAERGELSKACSAGNFDTGCDPEEMVESRFFGTEEISGPTVDGNGVVPMKNGILDTVAQGKGSQIRWYLMSGAECSDTTPQTCDESRRELGVFTPREDDHRVSPGEGSNIPMGPFSLTPGRLQASGVGFVSAQSSGRNGMEDSSCERAIKVSGRYLVGCVPVSLLSEACIAYSKDNVFMGK